MGVLHMPTAAGHHPLKSCPTALNSASRTREDVGRTPGPTVTGQIRPLNVPPVIFTARLLPIS